MSPFNNALTNISASTPKFIPQKPVQMQTKVSLPRIKRPTAGANVQTDAYGKAMRSAIKNTTSYK